MPRKTPTVAEEKRALLAWASEHGIFFVPVRLARGPDFLLPVPRDKCPGVFFHIRTRNARAEATPWVEQITASGHRYLMAYGWEAARDAVVDYLGMTEKDLRRARLKAWLNTSGLKEVVAG